MEGEAAVLLLSLFQDPLNGFEMFLNGFATEWELKDLVLVVQGRAQSCLVSLIFSLEPSIQLINVLVGPLGDNYGIRVVSWIRHPSSFCPPFPLRGR